MILVSLNRTWPIVQRGDATAEEAALGIWPVRPAENARLADFADVIRGVVRGRVVTAYDITGWRPETSAERAAALRDDLGRHFPRVVFEGVPSQAWEHMIGSASPGGPLGQWPVRYLDTADVRAP